MIESLLREIKSRVDSIEQRIYLEDKLLSRKETAELLGVNVSTLHNWHKKGVLEPYALGGRVYYKYSDIINSLELLEKPV